MMSVSALAHPVIWKGGQAIMFQSDSVSTDLMYHYSLNYNWSVGLHYLEQKDLNRDYLIAQSNVLLKRWNGRRSQGNLYILTGLGASTQNSSQQIGHIGFQADWETQEVYTFFRTGYYHSQAPVWSTKARLGFAPYIGAFDDMHTWLISEFNDQVINGRHDISIIPVVRVFKDTVLFEVGSNFSDHLLISSMFHF